MHSEHSFNPTRARMTAREYRRGVHSNRYALPSPALSTTVLHRRASHQNFSNRHLTSAAGMADKPRLPSVKSLLNMSGAMDISDHHPQPHGSDRRASRSSHALDHGAHSSLGHSHHRSRSSSSRVDKDSQPSSSSRHKRSDHQHRHYPSAHPARTASTYGRDESYLPSVNEVLRSARNGPDSSHVNWSELPPRPQMQADSSSTGHHNAGSSSSRQGYPCERCGRLFTRKSDANKHIRVVHDRLMIYSCSVCGRRFARKDYCTKHEKSLHNVVPPPTPYQLRRQLAKQRADGKREGKRDDGK